MLNRFRMPPSAIRDALLTMDDGRLSVDNIKSLKQYCPLPDEVRTNSFSLSSSSHD